MAAETILEIEDLHKTFRIGFFRKRVEAVRGISLKVERGEIFGYVGPNGAGKTTTMKMVLNLIHPDQGKIRIFGQPPGSTAARARLGYLPENPYIYTYLKPLEFLDLCGRLTSLDRKTRKQRSNEYIERLGLSDAIDRPIGKFSKGMMQRLGFCQALMHEPEMLILDEPFSGLDPFGRRDIRQLLQELREQGRTVLITSHVLADVEAVADRVAILQGGKLLSCGKLSDLLTPEVRQVEIELTQVNDGLRDALKGEVASLRELEQHTLVVVQGDDMVPNILRQCMDSGAQIVRVTPHHDTLEDLFVRQAGRVD